ncbi:MAG: glycosyltransferase family 39 protein [Planctomycetaceae bacterium]|nr:glycosyltransferase family 39 protein [Planctomycetaceae bacterium]
MLKHQLLILLAAGLVFFTNLGAAALFDDDEPKNAVCGREMFERGDWIVPTFNTELRTDKPILIYWIMLCSYTVFGVNEFAARFGSSVLAVGTSLLVYHLGRLLFHREVGLWSAIVLCTCLMFAAVGRAVTPDSTLIFCTTSAFLGYVWAVAKRHGGRFGEPRADGQPCGWDEFLPATWLESVPMYVAMGFAVLAKGPIGVLLPSAIIGLQLLMRRELGEPVGPWPEKARDQILWWLRSSVRTILPQRIAYAMWQMRVPLGGLIVAVIALPWYVAVGQQTDGAWLAGFLGGHNVGRFIQPMENHRGPLFYYPLVILLGTFPWSVFVPLSIWQLRRRLYNGSEWNASYLFIACWMGLWIGFFSCAQTKLPNYILPAYPAVALFLGGFLYDWQRGSEYLLATAFRHSCRVLAALGAVMLIAVPIVASYFLPNESWLALIGCLPLFGGGVAYRACQRNDRRLAVRTLAITAVGLAVLIVGIAPPRVARYQDGPYFGALVRSSTPRGESPDLATFDYFAPNLVFYSGAPVDRLKKPEQIAAYFDEHPRGHVLTRSDRLEGLKEQLPGDVVVLAQQRRFLRRHDLVLLGRTTQTAVPSDARSSAIR